MAETSQWQRTDARALAVTILRSDPVDVVVGESRVDGGAVAGLIVRRRAGVRPARTREKRFAIYRVARSARIEDDRQCQTDGSPSRCCFPRCNWCCRDTPCGPLPFWNATHSFSLASPPFQSLEQQPHLLGFGVVLGCCSSCQALLHWRCQAVAAAAMRCPGMGYEESADAQGAVGLKATGNTVNLPLIHTCGQKSDVDWRE